MRQLAIKRSSCVLPHPMSVSALLTKNNNQWNITFLPKAVLLLNLSNAQKHILFTFLTLTDTLFNCFVLQLFATVKYLAYCVNTGTEMLSALSMMFCSTLIQTLPFASWIHKHFWTSSGRHIAAWQSNLVVYWLLMATDLDRRNLLTFFHSFQCVLLGQLFLSSTEADIGWGGNLNCHLIACCVRNICAKNY